MAEHGARPASGSRDNGLRCAGYVAVGDVDPRVADALLETLRRHDIAAYVTPTPGTRGGYLEVQLPSRPIDRLFADSTRAQQASELVADALLPDEEVDPPVAEPEAAETGGAEAGVAEARPAEPEIDFEASWRQLVGSLQAGAGSLGDGSLGESTSVPVELTVGGDPALDEHFVPPPPPPLPRLRRVTVVALLAILAGLVVLATNLDGGSLTWLGLIALVSGVATLVWHLKDGPPTDSGWDDGAVV
jgi:hypothetical protein